MKNLTIITRTSNRPLGLKKLMQSIASQTYVDHITHIILADNQTATMYAHRIADSFPGYNYKVFFVQVKTRIRGFYNLYLNHGIQLVDDDLILFVDDDDYLTSNTCIQDFFASADIVLSNQQTANSHFFIVQFLRGSKIKPDKSYFPQTYYPAGHTSNIIVGKIGGSCIIFTKKQAHGILWKAQMAADYDFIRNMAARNPYIFLPIPIVQATPKGNKGKL